MKSKERNVLNLVLGVLLIIFTLLYAFTFIVAFKILASLCFVLAGAINMAWHNEKKKWFPLLLEGGLLLSLGGDWSIIYSFVMGAAFFAMAHVAYIVSYYYIERFHKKDLLWSLIMFAISSTAINAVPFINLTLGMRIVCTVYSFVISNMTGKAISNYLSNKNRLNLIICIGAVMFLMSDMMVLFNTFHVDENARILYSRIGYFIYFPAQFILAQSIKEYYKQ